MGCIIGSASIIIIIITIVSRVSAHGRLNITHDFGPHRHLPGIKISYILLYTGNCYSGLLKCGTWALTREWALAWDTKVYTRSERAKHLV